MKNTTSDLMAWTIIVIATSCGCDTTDRRIVEMAEQSAARQAEQNHEVAKQSQTVADAAHKLVEADAQARTQMIQAHERLAHSIQEERARLDREHEKLESERRSLAAARQREPLIAGAITSASVLLACLLPLVVCLYVLQILARAEAGDGLSELLVQEFVREDSLLLPTTPPAINGSAVPQLSDARDTT